ncbi:MAG: hypothetical protein RR595_13935 [Lysinibacillus sp.]
MMKKQLEFAGIRKVQTDLDHTQQEVSTVTLQFGIVGDDLDVAQRELVEVIQKAIHQYCSLPNINLGFDAFAVMKNEGSK